MSLPPSSRIAITSLVSSIVGFTTIMLAVGKGGDRSFGPLMFATVCGILGFVLGVVTQSKSSKYGPVIGSYRHVALAGLLLGYLDCLIISCLYAVQ